MSQFEYFEPYIIEDIGKLLDDTIKPKDKGVLLIDMFDWSNSPQRFDFWCKEYNNLVDGHDFSHEALMSLTVELNNGTNQQA